LAWASTLGLLLVAATPVAHFYFGIVSALPQRLVILAQTGLWFVLPLPALSVLQSWYQGAILHGRRTRGVTEAVFVYLVVSAITLTAGVVWGGIIGLYIGLASLTISTLAQTGWLWLRSRPVREQVRRRDTVELPRALV
jgi:hypothetical protein